MISIGMDIGGTKIAVGFLEDGGELKGYKKVKSSNVFSKGNTAVDSLSVFINDYIDEFDLDRNSIRGVGIGVPSVLDSHTKEVVSTPYIPKLNSVPLGPLLTPKLNMPVYVENDVNLIALGEHQHGRGKGISEVACVFVGTGLGCGLILNGQLYTGADGAAAEFGHMVYENQGRKCGCGAFGCFEMYCSGVALTYEAYQIFTKAEIDAYKKNSKFTSYSLAEYLIKSARSGHQLAKERIENAFFILGIAVTNLVNLLNPGLVILGGGIINGWPEGLDIVRDVVIEKARTVAKKRLVIDYPVLEDKGGLYGAASMVRLNTEKANSGC